MNAIIVSVGSELIGGQTIDTNSAYLARQLGAFGIEASEHWTVGDSLQSVAGAVLRAASLADVVIVTGGLGPTADDLTRQGLAEATGSRLVLDENALARIEEFFRSRGRTMVPANRLQAMIPEGCEPLANEVGTAPGIFARLGKAQIFALPGVPSEMRWMFDNAVAPRLPRGQGAVVHRIVHTFGQGESDLGERIADLMARGANPSVGTTVAAGMVSVRIASRAAGADEAKNLADQIAAEVKRRFGPLVVGADEDTMASVVGRLLRDAGQTLATAESCTGGLIGEMITSAAGASDYYRGGAIAYSNDLKAELLDVSGDLIASDGAVSEPVAAAMADGCRRKLQSDWSVSTTGIAGPAGGTESKPVGLVFVGLAGPDGVVVHRHVLPGTRRVVRLRAALTALNHLRLKLTRFSHRPSV